MPEMLREGIWCLHKAAIRYKADLCDLTLACSCFNCWEGEGEEEGEEEEEEVEESGEAGLLELRVFKLLSMVSRFALA